MLEEDVVSVLRRAFELEEQGDIEAAIIQFEKAAELGSVDACSKLGTILDDDLQPSRPNEAVAWYRRGAAAGDASCAWNLAMHYSGAGDHHGYVEWLQTAAEMGDPDASPELITGSWWNKHNAMRP